MINGAWGGRDGKDGIEGVTNPSQNMSNLPVETLEARYPLRDGGICVARRIPAGRGGSVAGWGWCGSTGCWPRGRYCSFAPTGTSIRPMGCSAAVRRRARGT